MKKIFYIGLAGIALFEVLRVYFIMPMPGSQGIESLDWAYWLHGYRWFIRALFLAMIAAGISGAFQGRRRWPAIASMLGAGLVVWMFNFPMMADHMFQQPRNPSYKSRVENAVDESSVVLGVEYNGEAKAYPIRFLVYHHEVQDVVGGRPVIVTYCSVCRTGRVFEPRVNGRLEKFRLVGMDHFNAMFEDLTTHSWWRQATGEAVAGPLKGAMLPGASYSQLTLRKWFELHPAALVMQADETIADNFDPEGKYERGKSKGDLTRTDPLSWQDKSWVIGVRVGGIEKAYDWNRLKQQRVINDLVGGTPIALVLAIDQKSYAAFIRPASGENFSMNRDTIVVGGHSFDLAGHDLTDPSRKLEHLNAYQEFWHSWRTFHPATLQDKVASRN